MCADGAAQRAGRGVRGEHGRGAVDEQSIGGVEAAVSDL